MYKPSPWVPRAALSSPTMHVVLVGYRAAGKTTAGRLVAERLGWRYLDVDRGIEEHCGLIIAEIFQRHGEPYYRDVESAVVAEMCAHDDAVVTFGGGTLMRPVNQEHARRDGLVVYLEAKPEELWRRIEADPASAATRPNLAGGGLQEVVTMLARRAPVYRANADLTLDATLPPEELADRIVAAVGERQGAGRR